MRRESKPTGTDYTAQNRHDPSPGRARGSLAAPRNSKVHPPPDLYRSRSCTDPVVNTIENRPTAHRNIRGLYLGRKINTISNAFPRCTEEDIYACNTRASFFFSGTYVLRMNADKLMRNRQDSWLPGTHCTALWACVFIFIATTGTSYQVRPSYKYNDYIPVPFIIQSMNILFVTPSTSCTGQDQTICHLIYIHNIPRGC